MLISDIREVLEGLLVPFRNEFIDAGMIPQCREPELGHTVTGTGLAVDDRFDREERGRWLLFCSISGVFIRLVVVVVVVELFLVLDFLGVAFLQLCWCWKRFTRNDLETSIEERLGETGVLESRKAGWSATVMTYKFADK